MTFVMESLLVTTTLLAVIVGSVESFTLLHGGGLVGHGHHIQDHQHVRRKYSRRRRENSYAVKASSTANYDDISIGTCQHKDWKLTYLYKDAAPGHENDPPLLLIHPVGIGLSSWFYKKFMDEFDGDNPRIYAPDLIGCGIAHGADPWNPNVQGLFFLLSWVEGVETLINDVVLPRQRNEKRKLIDKVMAGGSQPKGCIVLVQGGLAPVGVMLASRNPNMDMISSLILTSPPTYNDMVTAIPQDELKRNYDFLKSPIFGNLAFKILESRTAIQFFSDLFLFADKCDEDWLDCTQQEICIEARTPVQAFNAGLLQHRSYEDELKSIIQPTMVVSGIGDKRKVDRIQYTTFMKQCTQQTLYGVNVIPWENPKELIDLIKSTILQK